MQDHGGAGAHGPIDGRTVADLAWRKSRRSNPNGACVELAPLADGRVAMRNSRHPDGLVVAHGSGELAALLDAAKRGEFDDLIDRSSLA